MQKRAIALISGGLDSLLAAKVIMDQGIEVLGTVFVMQFASRDIQTFKRQIQEAADEAAVPVRFIDMSEKFLEVLKTPSYGYGANLNPCIDCKILMLKFAKKIMREEAAGFVITGEVLGERPMSQRRESLNIIQEKSLLNGYLLRPLSAKLLEETVPEKEGIVDRGKLLDINGRSREAQLNLAGKYNLTKFFAPGGGCLLTDPIFSRKLKDIMDKTGGLDLDDVALLKYGRHFRLDKDTKVVVGRDERDNRKIQFLKKREDVILRMEEVPGPYVVLRGSVISENIRKAAALLISHSKRKKETDVSVEFWTNGREKGILKANPMKQKEIEKLRI